MAIKPQILAKLRHGKLICQAIYPTFVETWNWLVRFTSTIKGDADVNPKTGVIVVDRTDPDHPIIRLRQDRLPVVRAVAGGNFPYNPEDRTIKTGYVIIARTPTLVSGVTVSTAGLVYLDVSMSSGSYSASIVSGAGSLPSPSDTHTYIPLYEIGSEFEVVADYRGAPHVQVYE